LINDLGRRPTIGFAHRGARDRAPDNSLEGFSLALELGAGDLEGDVWLTADGLPVLDHDGLIPAGVEGDCSVGAAGTTVGAPRSPSLTGAERSFRPVSPAWRTSMPSVAATSSCPWT